jgi:tRNA (cmo5U34)-methyltransferase
MNEFDMKAFQWDHNPMHLDRSRAVAEGITDRIPIVKDMTALEYGAGTGITGFLLKDYFREVILMDNSPEMTRVAKQKIIDYEADNMRAVHFDLEKSDYPGAKFDIIIAQMVLHHISDIETILKRFSLMITRGGYLAIADLYKEDGSFHGDSFRGHYGFDTEELSLLLTRYGFKNISHRKCFTVRRQVSDDKIKEFDIFLLIAISS